MTVPHPKPDPVVPDSVALIALEYLEEKVPRLLRQHKIAVTLLVLHSLLVIIFAAGVATSDDGVSMMGWAFFYQCIDVPFSYCLHPLNRFLGFGLSSNSGMALFSLIVGGLQWTLIGLLFEWLLKGSRRIVLLCRKGVGRATDLSVSGSLIFPELFEAS